MLPLPWCVHTPILRDVRSRSSLSTRRLQEPKPNKLDSTPYKVKTASVWHPLLHPLLQGIPINVSVIQGGMFSAGVEVACLLADVAFLEMDGVCAEFFQADW